MHLSSISLWHSTPAWQHPWTGNNTKFLKIDLEFMLEFVQSRKYTSSFFGFLSNFSISGGSFIFAAAAVSLLLKDKIKHRVILVTAH
jgi:hypothetical protein